MGLFFWKKHKRHKSDKERRRHPRIRVFLKIDYQIADDISHLNCSTRDISEGGLRFGLFQKITPGTPLKLKVHLADKKEPLEIVGKAIWAKETPGKNFPYEVGIAFESLPPHSLDQVKQLIDNISIEKQEQLYQGQE